MITSEAMDTCERLAQGCYSALGNAAAWSRTRNVLTAKSSDLHYTTEPHNVSAHYEHRKMSIYSEHKKLYSTATSEQIRTESHLQCSIGLISSFHFCWSGCWIPTLGSVAQVRHLCRG